MSVSKVGKNLGVRISSNVGSWKVGMGVRTGMSLSIVLLCLLYGGIREWRSPTSLSILLFWPDNRSVSEPVRASRSSTRAPTLR